MTYVSQVIADGAVGFWELGEASGATATDAAGNSNGTYGGSITYGVTGIPGAPGVTSVRNTTSSTSNKVTIPSVVANQLVDTFTIEVWIKRTATQGATQRIFGGNASGSPQLGFNASNQLQVGKVSVGNIVASTSALTDTTSPHHLVWTKTGATSHLYIDGVDVTGTISNLTFAANTGGWMVMEDFSANNAPPAGVTFAMAAIYPTALSAATVLNHYTLGSTGSAPVNTVAPAVTGTAAVGHVLTTTNGTWTDAGGSVFTYQWQRGTSGVYANIAGATTSTYTLADADDTMQVRCVVTDTDSTTQFTAANSNAVSVTYAAPTNTVAPVASGATTIGGVVSCTTGTWGT